MTQRGGGRLAQQPDHFHQPATGAPIESVSLRTDSGFSRPETLRADYPVLAESTYDSLHIAGVSGATHRSSPAGPGVVSVPRVSEGRPAEAALTRGTGHRSPGTSRWLPVTSHRSPVTGHGAPVMGHQSPVTGHRSPVTAHQSPVTEYQSPGTGRQLPVTSCWSPSESGPFTFCVTNGRATDADSR